MKTYIGSIEQKTEKGRDQNAKNTERSWKLGGDGIRKWEFGVRKIKANGKEVRGGSCEVGKVIGTGTGK